MVALAMLVVAFVPVPGMAAAPAERTIHVDAASFAYTPGVIDVNPGDRVTLELTSHDVVHGLYLDGYGISTQAEPGQPGELRFVADRDGAFHFRCAVPCGNLHPFMIGKLIVGPNLTWLRAVLACIIAAGGALAVFWRA